MTEPRQPRLPPGELPLLVVRLGLAAWLAGSSLLMHHLTRGPLGASDWICVIVIVASALGSLRRPYARFWMLAVSAWLGVSAFLLRGATHMSWANEWFVASALIFISVPAGDWFDVD